jgi:coenzyme PQQ precursor peptide PqqA
MEVSAMTWEAPEFVEIKMDAEINSYQDDFKREQPSTLPATPPPPTRSAGSRATMA